MIIDIFLKVTAVVVVVVFVLVANYALAITGHPTSQWFMRLIGVM